jgi:hypothetical protein
VPIVRSTISPTGAGLPPMIAWKASNSLRALATPSSDSGFWPLRARSWRNHWVRASRVRPSTVIDGPARMLIHEIGMRSARLAALPCNSRAISVICMAAW